MNAHHAPMLAVITITAMRDDARHIAQELVRLGPVACAQINGMRPANPSCA